jgi:hypothetical protein
MWAVYLGKLPYIKEQGKFKCNPDFPRFPAWSNAGLAALVLR